MEVEAFDNVWEAIEDDPAEVARLTLLSRMMMTLRQHIKAQGWTQKEAAEYLGVTQPRISDLVRGKVNLFSIDALVGLLTTAGVTIEMSFKDAA